MKIWQLWEALIFTNLHKLNKQYFFINTTQHYLQKILHQFRKLFTISYSNNRKKFIYFWKCLRTLNKILLLLCTYQHQRIFRLTDCVGNQSWVSVFIIHTQKKFIFQQTTLYSAVLQTYKIVIKYWKCRFVAPRSQHLQV